MKLSEMILLGGTMEWYSFRIKSLLFLLLFSTQQCKTDFISTYDLYGQHAQTQASTSVTVNSSGDTEGHSGSSAGGRRGHVEAEFRWERTTGPAKEPPLDAVAVLVIIYIQISLRSLWFLDIGRESYLVISIYISVLSPVT